MADLLAGLPPPVLASSGQEWQFHISTVRAHIGRSSGRSTGRSTPTVLASSVQEWQFHISAVRAHIGRSSGRSTGRSSPHYWHLVVKDGDRAHIGRSTPTIDLPVNGNFRFLLYKLFLADQVADLPPFQSSIDPLNTTTLNQLICTSSYWQIKWQINPPNQP